MDANKHHAEFMRCLRNLGSAWARWDGSGRQCEAKRGTLTDAVDEFLASVRAAAKDGYAPLLVSSEAVASLQSSVNWFERDRERGAVQDRATAKLFARDLAAVLKFEV